MHISDKICLASIKEQQKKWDNTSTEDLIAEAKNGSCMACFHLGNLYETGDKKRNIPVDYEEAVYWYKESLKSTYMPTADICHLIASLLEEKIEDNIEAWEYYRKAYCLEKKENRPAILAKIKELEPEAVQNRTTLEAELDELLQQEKLSDDDIRRMAFLVEATQIPEFPDEDIDDEEKWIKAVLPKAEVIVREAFQGDPIFENALGVFYSRGLVLPFDYAKQEYWFRCAYMDGYDRAFDNLCQTFLEQRKEAEWLDFIIVSARYGNKDAQRICEARGIDCSKRIPFSPLECDMLNLYSFENLNAQELTDEQMMLIDRFCSTDDVKVQKDTLRQLVPSTTETYLDAYLKTKPKEDCILDKLMDTEDESERRLIVEELDWETAERALQEIPYMPLTEEEKRCVMRLPNMKRMRSPHRPFLFHRGRENLTARGSLVSRIMDRDHRLTFDVANELVDRYIKQLRKDDAKQQEQCNQEQCKEEFDSSKKDDINFWLFPSFMTRFMKREAYTWMKMEGDEITKESLKKNSYFLFMDYMEMQVNPILDPLLGALGRCWEQDKEETFVKSNKTEALDNFLQAAEAGDPDAMWKIACSYYDREDFYFRPEIAVEWFSKAANLGRKDAMRAMALFYEDGLGVRKNIDKAIEWFNKAIDAGDIDSMTCLANIYFFDKYGRSNKEKAIELYHKAAEAGNYYAMYDLGIAYYKGNGVEKDLEKARTWFRKSADKGYYDAQRILDRGLV